MVRRRSPYPHACRACRQRAELPPDLLLAMDTAYSYSLDVLNPKALTAVRQRDNWQGRGEFYSFEVAMKVGRAVAAVIACMIWTVWRPKYDLLLPGHCRQPSRWEWRQAGTQRCCAAPSWRASAGCSATGCLSARM